MKENIILDVELNFTLGCYAIWGPNAHEGYLSDAILSKMEEVDLCDVEYIKLKKSWMYKWEGLDRIAKWLDRFLVLEGLMVNSLRIMQWIGIGGDFDHAPIYLEINGTRSRPPNAFKFNPCWIAE